MCACVCLYVCLNNMHSHQHWNRFHSSQVILFFSTVPFPGFIWIALVPVGTISEIMLSRYSDCGSTTIDIVDCERWRASYVVWVKDIDWLLGLSRRPLLGHGLVLKQQGVVGVLAPLMHGKRVLQHNQDWPVGTLQTLKQKNEQQLFLQPPLSPFLLPFEQERI